MKRFARARKMVIASILWILFTCLPAAQQEAANHLAGESSPYLLQHADNPVEWYPWGPEAFAAARSKQRPIFLSIGFATCHWCHLMERDSFTDPETARFLNEHFVSIKVDREERPDVDQVYMSFVQASTGRFGWPAALFLTPELKPFYGGTYLAKEAFLRQIRKIAEEWKKNQDAVLTSADRVSDLLHRIHDEKPAPQDPQAEELFLEAFEWYLPAYDRRSGGFGEEPKFPRPDDFFYLLRHHRRTGKRSSLRMVADTLRAMSEGGLQDQLAGGFHRYSADSRWHLPHFEKLLFLQAQLTVAYLELFQLTGEEPPAETARTTLDFVLEEMRDEAGGFYSSFDGASPCRDDPARMCVGVYYLWSWDELEEVLKEDLPLAARYFGLKREGNLSGEDFRGMNVLDVEVSLEEWARAASFEVPEARRKLERIKGKLLEARDARPEPPLDDKILTGWNGLMISSLAKGAQVLGEDRYLEAARKTARFLEKNLYSPQDGVLKRQFRKGKASVDGYVDDYAFFTQGLLDLYETSLEEEWLFLALEIASRQLDLFWDRDRGGFFNSITDDSLLVRVKELYDGVEPSPNGISAANFYRLAQMTGVEEWKERAEQTIAAFAGRLEKSPHAMPFMRLVQGFRLEKPLQVILAGSREDPLTFQLLKEVHKRFLPYRVILMADGGPGQQRLAETLEVLETVRPLKGRPTAYICEDSVCRMPTSDPAIAGKILDGEL